MCEETNHADVVFLEPKIQLQGVERIEKKKKIKAWQEGVPSTSEKNYRLKSALIRKEFQNTAFVLYSYQFVTIPVINGFHKLPLSWMYLALINLQ